MQTLIIHLLGEVAEMNKIWFALTQLLDSVGGGRMAKTSLDLWDQ